MKSIIAIIITLHLAATGVLAGPIVRRVGGACCRVNGILTYLYRLKGLKKSNMMST
jgi:hypothetical protein